MYQQKITVYKMVTCAFFVALVAIGAFLKIPVGLVPMTLQFLFVALAALLLGRRMGGWTVGVYILLGLIGIPVFTKGGGIWYVLEPTFGYLLGFAIGAYAAGAIAEKSRTRKFSTCLLACAVMVVIVYLVGLPYLYMILNVYMGKGLAVGSILKSYCLIFLPTDLLSMVMASLIASRLWPRLERMGLGEHQEER